METTTFKCLKCGWTGHQPLCQRVSSGHSCWSIRDICPACFKEQRGSFTVSLDHIVTSERYQQITDVNQQFYPTEAVALLNFPPEMTSFLVDHLDAYTSLGRPVEINGRREWNLVRKKYLDLLIKKVNG